jgi:hypothetical protein
MLLRPHAPMNLSDAQTVIGPASFRNMIYCSVPHLILLVRTDSLLDTTSQAILTPISSSGKFSRSSIVSFRMNTVAGRSRA